MGAKAQQQNKNISSNQEATAAAAASGEVYKIIIESSLRYTTNGSARKAPESCRMPYCYFPYIDFLWLCSWKSSNPRKVCAFSASDLFFFFVDVCRCRRRCRVVRETGGESSLSNKETIMDIFLCNIVEGRKMQAERC